MNKGALEPCTASLTELKESGVQLPICSYYRLLVQRLCEGPLSTSALLRLACMLLVVQAQWQAACVHA